MFGFKVPAMAMAFGLVNALPAPQVSGYTGADAPYATDSPTPLTVIPTSFGSVVEIPATYLTGPTPYPRVEANPTGATSHGPYVGSATVTGAVSTIALGSTVPDLGPNPTATYYNPNGLLQNPEPIPYSPAGGLGTNGTTPRYQVNSDFDFESLTLALYQEYIELDSFFNGIATFSVEDFAAIGINEEGLEIIRFMAEQETGHATLITNMLGEAAPVQCTYDYPYSTAREFIQFEALITAFGEAGVYGFQAHLDSREVAQMLVQSIAQEGRQATIFRQLMGLMPTDTWFSTGIPQSYAWTYLSQYISSCPENITRVAWQNFPALHVVNQANPNRFNANATQPGEVVGNRTADPSTIPPEDESCINVNTTGFSCSPAISHNRTIPMSFVGKLVNLTWDNPGALVGPNNSYVTSVAGVGGTTPKWVGWSSQYNTTYSPLIITGENTGYTYQPNGTVFQGQQSINGTMFISLTSEDVYVTPFNLSNANPYILALGLYQAG